MVSKNYVILGGGPTGIAAAEEAARMGADVTLVSGDAVGGRAAWSSLLPSKVHLTAAGLLHFLRHSDQLGVDAEGYGDNLEIVRKRVEEKSGEWSNVQKSRLEALGVRIVSGKGAFESEGNIMVRNGDGEEEILGYDRALIATGSVPIFFPSLKPDGNRILAPRLAKKLEAWPESIIVIGGGVTGAEFAYLFNTMGSDVTWVTDLDEMLPQVDDDIGSMLEKEFTARGIQLHKSSPVEFAEAVEDEVRVALKGGLVLEASHAFIAIGRRADLDALNLEAAGIEYSRSGVSVDEYGRTSSPAVYAAGDAAGPPYLANRGIAQALTAVRSSLDGVSRPYRHDWVVEAVYTEPQIAQVGLQEKHAAENGTAYEIRSGEYHQTLKGRLGGHGPGFLKILLSPADGTILGSAAVGAGATEILAPLAVAVRAGMAIDEFAEVFPAHPTMAELPFILARDHR